MMAAITRLIHRFCVFRYNYIFLPHLSKYITNQIRILLACITTGKGILKIFKDCITFCAISTCILNVLQNHVLDFIAFQTSHFCILRKLSGRFGYTKRYGVVRGLTFNQTALKEVLCYLIVNPMSFLNGIERNAVVQSQIGIVFEEFGIPFIYGIAIDANRNLFLLIVHATYRDFEHNAKINIFS